MERTGYDDLSWLLEFKKSPLQYFADLDAQILSLLDGTPLTEEYIYKLCDECLETKAPQPLIRALGEAFTQPAILARCFQRKPQHDADQNSEGKIKGKTREKLRSCLKYHVSKVLHYVGVENKTF